MTGQPQPRQFAQDLNKRLDVDFAMQAAGLGVWELTPITNEVVWDERCRKLFGLDVNSALSYGQVMDHIHPEDIGQVRERVQWAFDPASDGLYDQTFRVLKIDDGALRWLRFYGRSYFDESGQVNRFAGVAQDVTDQVLAQQQLLDNKQTLAESEARFRNIIKQIPSAILVVRGDDFVIDQINPPMLELIGQGPEAIGHPMLDLMPELANEFAWQQVRRAYVEGTEYDGKEILVTHSRSGVVSEYYYNLAYRPLWEGGKITGVIQAATDVTEQVFARKKLEEGETLLKGAVENGEMGLWELNMKTGITTYSERLKQLFEFTEDFIDWDHLYNPIHENDRARLQTAVNNATDPALGTLDEEYTIITQQTGRHRIVRAQAKMFFDKDGKPDKLIGSMRDITEQRQTQWALEQLVQHRTEELEAVNEELAAANEELATTNEELAANNDEFGVMNRQLEAANNLLSSSNKSLETFAYVASHDLQEPLRKIQQFSTLLMNRYGDHIGDGAMYVERMQSAAGRMSTLIDDLLDFSRVSTHRDINESVSLQIILSQVLNTLELTVHESGAQISIGPLPTITGDPSQLQQLFQNLLSNAIKFSRIDRNGSTATPVISVASETVPATTLPPKIKPVRPATHYYRIAVTDNGIGFDEKYLERVFQLFQRLHGRSEFAGTGIGLTICEKVVQNHGGAITAHSRLDEGATFEVYLPV